MSRRNGRDPHVRFRAVVKKFGGAAHVADRLCCSRTHVYDLMDSQRPGLEIALRIATEFGIPVEDWSTE